MNMTKRWGDGNKNGGLELLSKPPLHEENIPIKMVPKPGFEPGQAYTH